MLHGFGGNHRVWKHQIPVLQEKCNVLLIDLPSHNDGNVKLSRMKATLESVTAEIRKVLDEYKIQKATFIGVSLGCVFIKYIEEYYPQYISKALLVGAVCEVHSLLKVCVHLFSKIGDKLPFQLVYKTFSKIMMPAKESRKSREIFCECAKVLNKYEFKAWMNIFKENFAFGKLFCSKQRTNNLYVVGTTDVCFYKGIQEEVSLTGANRVVLKNCGHICNIDQKEKFNQIMINYCFAQ